MREPESGFPSKQTEGDKVTTFLFPDCIDRQKQKSKEGLQAICGFLKPSAAFYEGW